MQETPFSLYITVRKKLLADQTAPAENMLYSEMKDKYDVFFQNKKDVTKLLVMKEMEFKDCEEVKKLFKIWI